MRSGGNKCTLIHRLVNCRILKSAILVLLVLLFQHTKAASEDSEAALSEYKSDLSKTLIFRTSIQNSMNWGSSRQCQIFLNGILNLERHFDESIRRAEYFRNEDLEIFTYYQLKSLVIADFLKKLTTIFSNKYEGGGDLQSTPLMCISSNPSSLKSVDRQVFLAHLKDRDFRIENYLSKNVSVSWGGALGLSQEELLHLASRLSKGKIVTGAVEWIFSAAAMTLIYTRFISPLSKSRKAIALGSTFLTMATVRALLAEAPLEYSLDLKNRNPQYLWQRTFFRLNKVLESSLSVNVLQEYQILQKSHSTYMSQ